MGDACNSIMQILRAATATLVFIALAAQSLPYDAVVPEGKSTLLEAKASHASAAAKIQELLQAGKTEDECKALADSTIQEISDNVDASQDILNAVDKGEDCEDLGEDLVNELREKIVDAEERVKNATEALTAATGAPVQLGPQAYSFLKTGECAWIKTDPAYLAALQTYKDAVKEKDDAEAELEALKDELEDAIKEAARLEHECECKTQEAHAKAWEAANKNNDANQKAWTQAHNMQCVLAHTTYENCEVPPCPTVTKPTLPSGVAEAQCVATTMPVETEFYFLPAVAYKTWTDYEAECKAQGYTGLASIHNAAENQEVCDMCRKHNGLPCYIGAYQHSSQEGVQEGYSWSDGSPWDYVHSKHDGLHQGHEDVAAIANACDWHDWGKVKEYKRNIRGAICRRG